MKRKVAINYMKDIKYPINEDMIYPDKQYKELKIEYNRFSKNNQIYKMIRDLFKELNLDEENYDTENWNPLGDNLIVPGDTVLIKPNMVLDKNQGDGGEECLYTNPSLVVVIINYVWIALKGKGKIILADAPVQICDFEKLVKTSGYEMIVKFFKEKGVNIQLKDLRGLISHIENGKTITELFDKDGIIVDLKDNSEHNEISLKEFGKLRITNYNPEELLKHHNQNKHEYLIAKEALNADVIINMPKPKAHRKAGLTIGLKNFVGINTRKEYLPHHKCGSKELGGDEYQKKSFLLNIYSILMDRYNILVSNKSFFIAKALVKIANIIQKMDMKFFSKQEFREGSWYGNDTIWRTVVDINIIIKYADKNGVMQNSPQRKIFNIADMIVVGEKEGPLLPSPKYCGIIAMGDDIVCFDEIIATLLGMDIKKIPLLANIRNNRKYKLVDKKDYGIIVSNNELWNNKKVENISKNIALNIEASSGWKDHIELEK